MAGFDRAEVLLVKILIIKRWKKKTRSGWGGGGGGAGEMQ